jgi:hypothetical protein
MSFYQVFSSKLTKLYFSFKIAFKLYNVIIGKIIKINQNNLKNKILNFKIKKLNFLKNPNFILITLYQFRAKNKIISIGIKKYIKK